MNKKQERILEQYENQRSVYEEFTDYCRNEICLFIKEIGLDSHLEHIAFRTKQIESFRQKLQDGFDPKNLAETRDLSGVRAIFYIDSAVSSFLSQVALDRMIRDLECVNFIRGYRSPRFLGQYVMLRISPEKIDNSPKLKKFEDCLCELQVTNSLQNAWANVYHQTIYKNKKKFEKDFPKEASIIERRYESMVEGPLLEVSNNINYLYGAGRKLMEGHAIFSGEALEELDHCISLNHTWDLLNRLNNHIHVFGPKFHDTHEVLNSLEGLFHRLRDLQGANENGSKWLLDDVVKKIISIACGLFYELPEKICDFNEKLPFIS